MTAGFPVRSATVRANDLEFGLLEAGSGPLALCLHGFPDTAHTWRHLLPVLAGAGFHAVAPFMRGYAPTAVPADGAGPGQRAHPRMGHRLGRHPRHQPARHPRSPARAPPGHRLALRPRSDGRILPACR